MLKKFLYALEYYCHFI